jgi:2-amino-4-hydroxy-6-hydroxymethyldihydropteridine diphosphokinase
MVTVFLALGSNLGDREFYVTHAINSLARYGIEIVSVAGIYETEPKDVTNQPWFLNTVVQAKTKRTPQKLLQATLSLERMNQRVRLEPKAARTLDIDIIFYGSRIVDEPDLKIPHPRFSERKFVLVPLVEIAPDFVDPVTGRTISLILRACTDSSEVRLLKKVP